MAPLMRAKKVSLEAIKALREKSLASLSEVRAALEASDGDEAKAFEVLRQRGALIAEKRQGRATGQGRVESYIHHNGRLGALVEVNCETDFVARTPEFLQFCREIAMQVAATNPRYVRLEDVPADVRLTPEERAMACLLEQSLVKDAKMTVQELLRGLIAKTGENVVIRRFVVFSLGAA